MFLMKQTRVDAVLKEYSGRKVMTKVRHLKIAMREQTVQMIQRWRKRQGREHEGGLNPALMLRAAGVAIQKRGEEERLIAIDKRRRVRAEKGEEENGKLKGSQATLMHRRGRQG